MHEVSRRVWGLRLRRTVQGLALAPLGMLPSRNCDRVGIPVGCFRSSIPSPPIPCLRFAAYLAVGLAQNSGPCGSLLLTRRALASPTSCRFYPGAPQFHPGCVSRGPPIIPDGRFSQVRFGTLAFLPWAFPAWRGLSADSHAPRLPWFAHGLAPSPAEGLCRLRVRSPRCK